MLDLAASLLEFIGFDILFLGTVTLLAAVLARQLWDEPLFVPRFFTRCGWRIRPLLRESTAQEVITILIVAALAGMLINLTADELLDSPQVVCQLPGKWQPEDALKYGAIKDAARLVVNPSTQAVLTNHIDDRSFKAFFQHAYATTLQKGGAPLQAVLRFEFLAIKALRVLLLNSALIFAAFFIRLFVPGPSRKHWGDYMKSSATALILLAMSFGLLYLWTEQSKRYYKKLIHAYLVVASNEDPVLQTTLRWPIEGSPFAVPGLLAYGEFRDAKDDNGETDMFEFSSVAEFGGKLLVADNETGTLRRGLHECCDTESALFELSIENQGVRLNRSKQFAKAFAGLHKDDYDDIEAMAVRGNTLYLIGSHSLSNPGGVRKNRQVLIRVVRNTDGELQRAQIYRGLMANLVEQKEILGLSSTKIADQEVIQDLNIEGLTFDPDSGDLLLGLRGPLIPAQNAVRSSRALVLQLHNVDELLASKTPRKAILSVFAQLDLGGRGISSLDFDPETKSFFVAASPVDEDSVTTSLFQWQAPFKDGTRLTEIMSFPGHKLEGVAAIQYGDPPRKALLLAFDEENVEVRKDGTPIHSQFGRLLVVERR